MAPIAINSEHLFARREVREGSSLTIVDAKEAYLESPGGSRYGFIVNQDAVSVIELERARRHAKRDYAQYAVLGTQGVGILHELPWTPVATVSSLCENILPGEYPRQLCVARDEETADYNAPTYGFVEVTVGVGAVHLSAVSAAFAVYTPTAPHDVR